MGVGNWDGGVATEQGLCGRSGCRDGRGDGAARFAELSLEGRERFGYVARSLDAGEGLLSTRQSSLVVDPPNGRVPIKASAESVRDHNREREADDYLHTGPWDRCISRAVPGSMFPAGYNNAYRIVQTPDSVVILHEVIHDVRVIPVTDRPHIDTDIRQWMGDARGHWEGGTLVVDTTTRDPDYVMYEYACHEGNRALPLMLRGARVDEASRR